MASPGLGTIGRVCFDNYRPDCLMAPFAYREIPVWLDFSSMLARDRKSFVFNRHALFAGLGEGRVRRLPVEG